MAKDFVAVRVSGVSVEEGESLPLVYLREGGGEGEGGLGLRVGPFEASAILLHLEGIVPTRPLAHDLLAEFFREGGLSLERVELFGPTAEEVGARLVYRRGFSRRSREVRPADALALALRLHAPVCAERRLLAGPARTLVFRRLEGGLGAAPRAAGGSGA